MELLQERSELLLLRRRQVSQSCLFPEHALRELAAAEECTGVILRLSNNRKSDYSEV